MSKAPGSFHWPEQTDHPEDLSSYVQIPGPCHQPLWEWRPHIYSGKSSALQNECIPRIVLLKHQYDCHLCCVYMYFPGARVAAGNKPTDSSTVVQTHDPGQFWRHVPGGQPQRVCSIRPHHAARLLGAQLWFLAKLLLQWLHQQVCADSLQINNSMWLYQL